MRARGHAAPPVISLATHLLSYQMATMDINSKQADAMLAEYAALRELHDLPVNVSQDDRNAKIKAWWEADLLRRQRAFDC